MALSGTEVNGIGGPGRAWQHRGRARSGRGRRRRLIIEELLASCRAEVWEFEALATKEAAEAAAFAAAAEAAAHASSSSFFTEEEEEEEEEEEAESRSADTRLATVEVLPLEAVADEGFGHPDADVLATGFFRALVQDNTVMECNIKAYDAALCCAVREVRRLKHAISQMEGICGQLPQLQELVTQELKVHAQLRMENRSLVAKREELVSMLQEASASQSHEDSAALAGTLIAENNALRKLLESTGPWPGPPFQVQLSARSMAGSSDAGHSAVEPAATPESPSPPQVAAGLNLAFEQRMAG